MARQVLPIVGAVVGAYFGNPQLGYAIGSIIGNAVDPQVINGPALGEGQVNTAREGVYRPIVLGIGAVGCNIINVGPEIIRTKRDRQSKGGGPVVKTRRRYRTFALRICEGEADLLRIWQGEKLVYDIRTVSVIPEESAKYAEGFTFYTGDESQLPDPDLEAYLGIGNANAYRGTSYIVFKHFDLTDTQGSIPNFRFEMASRVEVEAASVMALGSIDNSFNRHTAASADGSTWPATVNTALSSSTWLQSLGSRVLINNSLIIQYTDDAGATWNTSTGGGGGAGGAKKGDSIGNIVLVPNSILGMHRSDDSGISFTELSYPSYPRSNYITMLPGFAISASQYANYLSVSTNNGVDWSIGGTHNLLFSAGGDVAKGDGKAVFGGSISGDPGIVHTENGTILVHKTIPGASGTVVRALSYGVIGGQGIWMLGTDAEELFWSHDLDDWTASTTPFTAVDIEFTGERFVLAGSVGGVSSIATCDDGKVVSTVTQPFDYSLEDLAVVQPTASVGKIVLSSIIAFIHRRCGHISTQYDVSELTDLVDGVVFADGYNGSDAIKTIIPIYFADASEHDAGSGYKVNYIKRGKPVVRTITIDDLVDEPDEAVRQDSLERPAKLHLHFQNPTIGYAAAKATNARTSPDVLVTGEVSVQVPITFSAQDEPWQIANKLHKVTWVEVAGTQELVLAENNIDLVPTDCIGLFLRGQLIRYRMTSQSYADGMLKCEFTADRQSAYTSNITGIELPEPPPPPQSIVGPTISAFLDIPALLDGHDALVSYAAATGQTPAWWGADYERSLDDGANYSLATEFDGFNTIMGTLQADVTAASPHYTDTTNVVRVALFTDDPIESLTQQQFLSEGGAFALSWEDSGERYWEILQYRDAEQDSNGDWLLSTLLRGRLNTEAAEHLAGAMFVLLDNSVHVMPMQSAWLGMELTHRAVSNGETPESAVPYTDEFTGKSQTEWPVANLLLERDGDDIEATAIPRHRFGTDDAPVQSINHDGYRWTATDGVNTATADTDPPAHTFDVTGWSTPVTVTVAQLNRITGAGPIVSEDIA